MNITIKSQSSVEFVVILCLILTFFVLLLNFLSGQVDDVVGEKQQMNLEYVLDVVERELMIAKDVPGNYERTFVLPKLDNIDYMFSIVNGKELILNSGDRELVRFLSSEILFNLTEVSGGDILKIIQKRGDVALCDNECSDLFSGAGALQCRSGGVWETCEFKFGDFYNSMSYDCGSSDSANLILFAFDDSYTVLDEVAFDSGDESFVFKDVDVEINESGRWDVRVVCSISSNSLSDSFNVPYGFFTFYPIEINADCSENISTGFYDCPENANFTLAVKIRCNGGECGDANIWMDP